MNIRAVRFVNFNFVQANSWSVLQSASSIISREHFPVVSSVRLLFKWVGKNLSCCDLKAQAAWAQSFALWQQVTIEFTCHDHSIIACLHHIYHMWFFAHIPFVVLCAHPIRRESHIQRNASGDGLCKLNFSAIITDVGN